MVGQHSDSFDDPALIEICNCGDAVAAARAFETLYKRHRDYVVRVARRFSSDRDIALDVLQETFVYLLKQFPPTGSGFVLTAKLTTYLYPVAKNFAISAARKSARLEIAAENSPDDLPDPSADPIPVDNVDAALARLSADHREVLLLRFVDDMSLAEISEALEIPLGTVKSRAHLAIQQLRGDPKIKDLFGP